MDRVFETRSKVGILFGIVWRPSLMVCECKCVCRATLVCTCSQMYSKGSHTVACISWSSQSAQYSWNHHMKCTLRRHHSLYTIPVKYALLSWSVHHWEFCYFSRSNAYIHVHTCCLYTHADLLNHHLSCLYYTSCLHMYLIHQVWKETILLPSPLQIIFLSLKVSWANIIKHNYFIVTRVFHGCWPE